MSKSFEFISGAIPYYIATVKETENGPVPALRPFGAMMEYKGDLYFGTADTKEVYAQLKKNGNVEVVAFKAPPVKQWVRISGVAEEVDDLETKAQMLVACPPLTKNFKTADAPHFAVFKIANKKAKLIAGPNVEEID